MQDDKPKKKTWMPWTEERKQARKDKYRKMILDAAEHVRLNRLEQKKDNG